MTDGSGDGSFLVIRDLVKKFGKFTALSNISLDVNEGEFVCFLGPSGCGKTTLLRAIAGLDIQTSGSVYQAGQDISALPPSERDFGIVFQSYALFPNLSVESNVAYGLQNSGAKRGDVKERVAKLLDLVGLPDQGIKYPSQLSGGQQQRVALARALATSPGLLLLDEPLSALDAKVRVHLRHEVKLLQERVGVTTIMVTHDQEEALAMADRIVVMNHGVIEQVGTPTEIYRDPQTLFVADFIGETNQLKGKIEDDGRVRIGSLSLAHDGRADTGGEGTAVIRPEDVVPLEEGSTETPPNSFTAKISELEFLGSFWRTYLVAPGLEEQKFRADFSVNAVRRLSLGQGKSIQITLPPDCLRFFNTDTSQPGRGV